MNIFMTADTIGGVWTYALDLARALRAHPVQIALATMGRSLDRTQRRAVNQLPNVQVYESEYALEWMDDPWCEVDAAGDWLRSVAEQVEPDLVHLNNFAHGTLDWQAPVLMVGHSCVLSWWRAVENCAAPGRYDEYRRRVQAGLQAADLVVAPTRAMLQALRRHYGPFQHSCAIANGRDPRSFAPAAQKEPFVLTVGRLWDKAKNVAALDAVAPDLAWPIRVAGEEMHPGGGQQDLRNVRPLGHLSTTDLAQEMARASIYALPARYEPFGLSALEAALSGCVLVLGDIPSLREVWDDAALYVPSNDRTALRRTLQQLIGDQPMRRAYAQRARQRAQRYTPQRMASTYWVVYQILVQEATVRQQPSHLSPALVPNFPANAGVLQGHADPATGVPARRESR